MASTRLEPGVVEVVFGDFVVPAVMNSPLGLLYEIYSAVCPGAVEILAVLATLELSC